MKIQCNACEAAAANVLCCADEAALCLACDEKIHAANKLASKHQRVPLSSSSSHMPKCDICQETVGYFFCLEDRALLCRKCDVGIHMANSFVSGHQRFLLTGVKVGLGASEPGGSSTTEKSNYKQNFTDTSSSQSISMRGAPIPWSGESNEAVSGQLGEIRAFSRSKVTLAGSTAPGSISEWGLCEFLGLTDVNQNDGSMTSDSSKVDGRYYQ